VKTFLLVASLLASLFTAAQNNPPGSQKKKPAKPPTSSEINEMMKGMQQGMDNLSPEDKALLDSMGIRMPNAASRTWQNSLRGMPVR
jgi:hypothetical protein